MRLGCVCVCGEERVAVRGGVVWVGGQFGGPEAGAVLGGRWRWVDEWE